MAKRRRRRRDGSEFYAWRWRLEADVDTAAAAGGPVAVAIYAALRAWAGTVPVLDGERAPSVAELAERIGTSARHVRRFLPALEQAGLLEILRPPGRKPAWLLPRLAAEMRQAGELALSNPDPGQIRQGLWEFLSGEGGQKRPWGTGSAVRPAHPESSRDFRESRDERPPEKVRAPRWRPARRRAGPADLAYLENRKRKLGEQRAALAPGIDAEGGATREPVSDPRRLDVEAALRTLAPHAAGPERAAELALADQIEEESGRLGPVELELLREAEGGA